MENRKTVVEGYWATQCVKELCQTRGLEAPILGQVQSVLYQETDPQAALEALMGRDLKAG